GLWRKKLHQRIPISLLALRVAEAVDLQRQILNSAAPVKIHLKQNAFHILRRIGDAKRLGAKLMMLSQAALLRALIAEIRRDVIHLRARALLGDQTMLDGRAN